MRIDNSDALMTSITGFASLDSIGGELRIRYNDVLPSLPPFFALRHIGAGLGTGEYAYYYYR